MRGEIKLSTKVITYVNPKSLGESVEFKSYRNYLHVCATKNMRDGVYERFQKNLDNPFITAPVVGAISLIDKILGPWSEQQTKLKQYLYLTDIIKTHVAMDDAFKSSFRRNQIEILDTIRMLEVCGLKPSDLQELELTPKEQVFQQIWSKFESHHSIQELRKLLSYGIKKRLEDEKIIQDLIRDYYKNDDDVLSSINQTIGFDTIVLHGFYFITPEQQRIFLLLKDAGVNIVFLNLYDDRYNETFSFVEEFISSRYGWVDKDSWEIEKWNDPKLTLADKFLSDFEGKQLEVYHQKDLKVMAYQDFYTFLSEYEKENEKINKTYLAPNSANLNDRLQEYYPDLFKSKRHFLSYPIGQFLYQLHLMWSEQEKSIILSENGIFECFASGWLYDTATNMNAKDYTKVLDEILPYFKGCVKKDLWLKRAEELLSIIEHVVPVFKVDEVDRFQKMMSSPFTRFAHFSKSKDEVMQIVRFIKMIFEIAQDLFGDGEKSISLSEHFAKLRKLVFESNPYLENEINKEEKQLIEELKKTLEGTPEVGQFSVDDISTAISLYLSGRLSNSNSIDEKIRGFIEIDGEAFKENGVTHVTGLDENSLPYSEFKLPWPLGEQVFNDIAKGNSFLSLQVLRNNNVKQITRYLVYNLLQFSDKIELSWMVQYEDKKNLDKAIYLTQLDLEPNCSDKFTEEKLQDINLKREIKKEELDSFLAYPVDALAEFMFCPRRFYYSYLSGQSAVFKSEFVHEFLFGNLLKTVGVLVPSLNDERIKEEVFKLFPYWSEFKKNLIAEENMKPKIIAWTKRKYGGYIPYCQDEISDLRKLFLFPILQNKKADKDSKAVAEAIDALYHRPETVIPTLREDFDRQLQEYPTQMQAIPSGKCRYCPHNKICPEAYHPVDDTERKMVK
jgi:hypothetical protein